MKRRNLKNRVFLFIFTICLLLNNGVVFAEKAGLDEGEQNTAPTILLTEPQQSITIDQGEVISIAWEDEDPDDNALISIAYDLDDDPVNEENHVWIAQDLEEDLDDEGDVFAWDTAEVPAGEYYIWAVISDTSHEAVYAVTENVLTIQIAEEPTEEPSPEPTAVPTEEPAPEPTAVPTEEPAQEEIKYFQLEKIVLDNGVVLEKVTINGPPEPPAGYDRPVVELPDPSNDSIIKTTELTALVVPAFDWSFGCSATSAAMIAGYHDRTGYSNMYTGPTNGGVMPLDNSSWPDWVDSCSATRHQCPLSATHNGLDGRTTKGHVDDYWVCYGTGGPHDPWYGSWTEHTYGDCTADYMKTNQWDHSYENTDGSTKFYSWSSDAAQLTCSTIDGYGILDDGTTGYRDFIKSRGYTVGACYNQLTDNVETGGFSFTQYKTEIDAGYPVMLHVTGHTMVGVGYTLPNTVILHDTWDYLNHTMTWGGSYSGMTMRSVSIVHPTSGKTKFDFDGDGNADISVFRPSIGYWLIRGVSNTQYGASGDDPVPADYNNDSIADIAVFRPSNGYWYIRGVANVHYGASGDIPVPADYNGDGTDDIAVFRPSIGYWLIRGISNTQYGASGDIPIPKR